MGGRGRDLESALLRLVQAVQNQALYFAILSRKDKGAYGKVPSRTAISFSEADMLKTESGFKRKDDMTLAPSRRWPGDNERHYCTSVEQTANV